MSDPRDDRTPADAGRDREEGPDEPTDAGRDREEGPDKPTDAGRDRGEDPKESTDAEDRSESTLREGVAPVDSESGRTPAPTRQGDHGKEPPRSIEPESRKPSPTRQASEGKGDRWRRVLQYAFDIVSSVVIVGLIGALLFATSGVWPPLVAIESPSMEPHIDTGDLVFVMDENRFAGPGAIEGSGVVPARAGEETGYRTFEGYGDVIIYEPNGNSEATPIIHRAMLWVEAGEDWYDRADPTGVGGADNCDELANCPAPHAGFITKGDNTVSNRRYDQAMGISEPVKPEWVIGTAEYGVPGLGQVRLLSGDVRSANVTGSTNSVGVATIAP